MKASVRKEAARNMYYASIGEIGMAARGMSALIRAANKKDRNELITIAADVPAVVQHADFII